MSCKSHSKWITKQSTLHLPSVLLLNRLVTSICWNLLCFFTLPFILCYVAVKVMICFICHIAYSSHLPHSLTELYVFLLYFNINCNSSTLLDSWLDNWRVWCKYHITTVIWFLHAGLEIDSIWCPRQIGYC